MQIEKLHHYCFICDDVREGDLYPVGGDRYSKESDVVVRVDFDAFYERFNVQTARHFADLKKSCWQEWFKQQCPDVDPELLTLLQVFTFAFESKRKKQSSNVNERNATYRDAAECPPTLSEMFNKNQAKCVEISLLAKKFLDSHGVKCKIFNGHALLDYKQENIISAYRQNDIIVGERHTFLIIEHNGQELIFDPANPKFFPDGRACFSLLRPCCSISSQMHRLVADCLMIEAQDVLTQSPSYYGVGDAAPIPEELIIHANSRADGRPWAAATAHRDKNAGTKQY